MASSVNSQPKTVLFYLKKFREDNFQSRDALILAKNFIDYIQNPQTKETAEKVEGLFFKFLTNRYSSLAKLSDRDSRIVSLKGEISELVKIIYTAQNYKTDRDPRVEIGQIISEANSVNHAIGMKRQACLLACQSDSDDDSLF